MRLLVPGVIVLAAAAVAAGCASKRCCDTGPGLEKVWVPPRVEKRLCMETVPAVTRPKTVELSVPCRDRHLVDVTTPVRCRVEVPDRATALVPAYRPTCVPVMGYREVEDHADRLCPTYECRCVERQQEVTVVRLGVGVSICRPPYLIADVHEECRTVLVPTAVRTGEHLVSVPAGTHLEQTPVGAKVVPLHVGADRMPCVTGTHFEDRVVGSEPAVEVVDRGIRRKVVGHKTVQKEVLPWRYEVVEKECVVPGFWAYLVDEAPAVRPPGVITRAEYEELLKDARR